MRWTLCFFFAIISLVGAVVLAISNSKGKNKRLSFLKPLNILIIGVFIAGIFIFYPVNFETYADTDNVFLRVFKSIILSAYDIMGLFVINTGFEQINEFTVLLGGAMKIAYPVLASAIFIIAPILTFGFILSFFSNAASNLKYLRYYGKNVYVFSELNQSSVALATDIAKNHSKAVLIFTDVRTDDDDFSDQTEKLTGLNVIYFKKDISSVNLKFHGKKSKIFFFLISNCEEQNVKHFTCICDEYKEKDFTELYLFSSSKQSDMLLSNTFNGKLAVRRINSAQSLIYNNLYYDGYKIFENAKMGEDGKKVISAVIVGMGNYGSELTKTLAWFCQMDGYTVKINAFDKSPDALKVFSSSCPELINEEYNGKKIEGEAEYEITVHSDCSYESADFDEKINALKDVTYVFVSIGSDENNIDCAAKLRTLFARNGLYPVIKVISHNADLKNPLENAVNFKGQPYDLQLLGDVDSTYCEKVILRSELEADALARHKKYGAAESFWQFEYNYKSSTASAIHMRARIKCGIKGADKRESELTVEEAHVLEVLEHKRWNAYMRSEGYVYGDVRNDLAKMHNNLVRFDTLSEEDKRKDRRVGSK